MWPLLAALGLVKGISDVGQKNKQNKMAAAQTRYSPWTHAGVGQTQPTGGIGSVLGDTLAGGVAGYGLDQSITQNDLFNKLLKQNLWNTAPSIAEAGSGSSVWDLVK